MTRARQSKGIPGGFRLVGMCYQTGVRPESLCFDVPWGETP